MIRDTCFMSMIIHGSQMIRPLCSITSGPPVPIVEFKISSIVSRLKLTLIYIDLGFFSHFITINMSNSKSPGKGNKPTPAAKSPVKPKKRENLAKNLRRTQTLNISMIRKAISEAMKSVSPKKKVSSPKNNNNTPRYGSPSNK